MTHLFEYTVSKCGMSKGSQGGALWDTSKTIPGSSSCRWYNGTEKGEQNPSQISRDHHVTRSLLYVWWQLYQERGETAFVPTQAFHSPPEVDRPQNAKEQIAHLERLCGQQALELDLLRSEVDVLKKAWHLLPSRRFVKLLLAMAIVESPKHWCVLVGRSTINGSCV
jgi:transposase-like protein